MKTAFAQKGHKRVIRFTMHKRTRRPRRRSARRRTR